MKKITLLVVFNLSFLIFNSQKAKAQYVTIPDANFVTWLTQNYPSCMNGNQMDTTCSGILNATTVYLGAGNVSNLSGIQYFDSLHYLNCDGIQLSSLPMLPSNLQILKCSYNQLSSLPVLPSSLQFLDCIYNQLVNLPILPSNLQQLICKNNQLSSLPTLPSNLYQINCENNQLSSLPTLPSNLIFLRCNNNQLTILPQVPNTLQSLICSNNQLNSLPILPTNLQNLYCEANLLTSLPILPNGLEGLGCSQNQLNILPSLPSNLQSLSCDDIQLTSLPSLPNSLVYISCNSNQLTSLPTLPSDLQTFYCEDNQITSLPTFPSSLQVIFCGQNQLTSLPALPDSLSFLYCEYNQLVSLPALPNSLADLKCNNNLLTSLPALPSSLSYLKCQGNQLSYLPQLPSEMASFFANNNNISCLVNLPQIASGWSSVLFDISNNPLTCVPNQTSYSLGLPLCLPNDPINNPNNCGVTNCNAQYTLIADSALQSVWYLVNQCIGSDSLSADSLNYVWSWGDSLNSTSTGAYPSFTYSSPGNYVICVTITDTISGCTSTYCDSSTYISKSLSNQMIQVNVVPSYPPLVTRSYNLNPPTRVALRCYPNPAKDILYIELSEKFKMQNAKWTIQDVLGNEILFNYLPSTNNNKQSINIQHLPRGVYFVKVGNDVKKFIKD